MTTTDWRLAFMGIALSWATIATAQTGAVQSLDIRIPIAPQPVRIGTDLHLFYELHVTSFRSSPLALTGLDVVDARSGKSLRRLQGSALADSFETMTKEAAPLILAPGMNGVIYLSLPLDGEAPHALNHRMTFNAKQTGESHNAALMTDELAVDSSALPKFSAPLRGGLWAALYDPSMSRGHRRVVYAVDGHAHLPGRFAVDFFGVDAEGKTHRGSGERPSDYLGYGADVLAVADGTVVAARDDMDEPAMLTQAREHTAIGDATGAYVTLDIGGGHYVFYEHLKPGLAVRIGQQVRQGARLGALGMTGQAMTPHLHFHVANANAPLAAEGTPYHLAAYRVLGRYDSITDFGTQPWRKLEAPIVLRESLPAPNVVVDFEP